ncbi:MAG TPA: addiction module protein [Opitutaceae bacterium]|nr:addiction module protein [Opitutaceae bacterium]
MDGHSSRIQGLADASVDEKLALIDELWESVRRSGTIQVREDHLEELRKRLQEVSADPAIAFTPAQARALLKM